MADVILNVNGVKYGGWTEIKINLSIEQIAGTFELSLTEKWAGQKKAWPIKQGDECEVLIDGEAVITGYIDTFTPSFDKSQHSVSVSGRDKTGDLVDCSAVFETGQWKKKDLLAIATDLCKPFGISVKNSTDIGEKFMSFTIQVGETVFEALETAARQRGVLLVADGKGGLEITRAKEGKASYALVEGENILAASGTFSQKDRFSLYRVKGENCGSDFSTPEQNAQTTAEVSDTQVKRYRPLVILSEQQGDVTVLKKRADWEKNVRAGRGSRVKATVQGWKYNDMLWKHNLLVTVRSDYLRVNRDMIVSTVSFTLGEDGTKTQLSLCLPEAFSLIALPEPADEDSL